MLPLDLATALFQRAPDGPPRARLNGDKNFLCFGSLLERSGERLVDFVRHLAASREDRWSAKRDSQNNSEKETSHRSSHAKQRSNLLAMAEPLPVHTISRLK